MSITIMPLLRYAFASALAAMLLASCESIPKSNIGKRIQTDDVYDLATQHDTQRPVGNARSASQSYDPSELERAQGAGFHESVGTGDFTQQGYRSALNGSQFGNAPISFAFDNAPVAEVINVVIGQSLGADFVIEPSVSGDLTFKLKDIPKSQVPEKLSAALNVSGLALIQTSENGFIVVNQSAAARFSSAPVMADQRGQAGQVIYPLKWVSATEMQKVLRPFTPQGASVEIDTARETLIFKGSPQQIDSLVETAQMFDVDWLGQMSFGVYEVLNVPPEAMIEELDKIYGGPDGPIGSQVEFVALPRLSSVLVISKRPERLRQAESWVRRLDVNSGGEGRQFRFISVQSADAEVVAETLSDMFQDDSGSRGQFRRQGAEQDRQSSASQNNFSQDRVRIKSDQASNSLIIYSTDSEFRQIKGLLEKIDILPDQVLIEVVIAEVSLTDDLKFGVQWFFDSRTDGEFTFSDAGSGAVSARFPGFAYTFNGNYVQAAISALSSVTDLEVVSSPQIVTQDNQSATLQVGDQVPVVTQSAVSVDNPNAPIVNSIQYRDTGILLTVTPRINGGDIVVLEVSQEVSSAVPTSTSGIDAPTIQQRQFNSVVNIADGETLALGGLIRSTKSKGRSGIPYVKDIPIVGNLFSGQSDDRARTELVIFLTPHIIRNAEDSRFATQHIRSKMSRIRGSFTEPDEKLNDQQ